MLLNRTYVLPNILDPKHDTKLCFHNFANKVFMTVYNYNPNKQYTHINNNNKQYNKVIKQYHKIALVFVYVILHAI